MVEHIANRNKYSFHAQALVKGQDKFLLESDWGRQQETLQSREHIDYIDAMHSYWNLGAICTVLIKSQLYDIAFPRSKKKKDGKRGMLKKSVVTPTDVTYSDPNCSFFPLFVQLFMACAIAIYTSLFLLATICS